ncbi:hypothetical protein ACLMJK_001686 [Lecanora helva]
MSELDCNPDAQFMVPEFGMVMNSLTEEEVDLMRQGFYDAMPQGNDGSFENYVYQADEGLQWIIGNMDYPHDFGLDPLVIMVWLAEYLNDVVRDARGAEETRHKE